MVEYVYSLILFAIVISIFSYGLAAFRSDTEKKSELRSFIHILYIVKSGYMIGIYKMPYLIDNELLAISVYDTMASILLVNSYTESIAAKLIKR